MSVCVMCPTRDRPGRAALLARSVLETSDATIVFYIDEDQWENYKYYFPRTHPRVILESGGRQGPAASANFIAHVHREHSCYGLMCDDMEPTVRGWDRYIEEQIAGRIGVVSPSHSMGNHVDVPFVSREWIEALGWFCYPTAYHYVWPTVIGLLGEASGTIVHAPADRFFIQHHQESTRADGIEKDALGFYKLMLYDFHNYVRKIKEAKEAEDVTSRATA